MLGAPRRGVCLRGVLLAFSCPRPAIAGAFTVSTERFSVCGLPLEASLRFSKVRSALLASTGALVFVGTAIGVSAMRCRSGLRVATDWRSADAVSAEAGKTGVSLLLVESQRPEP